MSDRKEVEDGTKRSNPGRSQPQVPKVVLSNPFEVESEIEHDTLRRQSRPPALRLDTSDLSDYLSSHTSQNLDVEEDLASHRSPTSTFLHKIASVSRSSSVRRLSPSRKKVRTSLSTTRSGTSHDLYGSANVSTNSLEEADPEVLSRGLRLALGDNLLSNKGGLWLPVSSPGPSHSSGSEMSDEDLYDIASVLTDNENHDSIPLRDLRLDVPSYPNYLAETTSPIDPVGIDSLLTPSVQRHNNANLSDFNTGFDHDFETGLQVPSAPLTAVPSPRHQLSNAFKKFSARVNGHSSDEEDDEVEANRSGVSDNDISDDDYPEDTGYFSDNLFEPVSHTIHEGSSDLVNAINEPPMLEKSSLDPNFLKSQDVSILDDESIATTPLSGFEEIQSKPSILHPRDSHEDRNIRLFGNSLKFFGPTNRFRIMCSRIAMKNTFELSITLLIFLQTALLAYQQWRPEITGYVARRGYTVIDWILFFINCFHTAEMIIKLISFGLIDDSQMFQELNIPKRDEGFYRMYIKTNYKKFKNYRARRRGDDQAFNLQVKSTNDFGSRLQSPKRKEQTQNPVHSITAYELEDSRDYFNIPYTRAYLRSSWNRVDLISLISFWVSFLLSINHYDLNHHILIFRSLMCLRILRLTNFSHGTSVILKALKKASPELIDMALLLGSFWIFFSIIGVQSFKSSLRRHCVWFNPEDASDYFVNDDQFCGSYVNLSTLERMPYVLNDGTIAGQAKGFMCPANSRCVSNQNPYNNSVSFDNIANSFELVFVVMSANTFTDLMYMTMDSDTMAASLFFIFEIFLVTVWIVNLLIAVIVNAFTIARDEAALQSKKKKNRTFIWRNLRTKILYNEFKSKSKALKWYYKCQPLILVLISVSLGIQCLRTHDPSPRQLKTLRQSEAVTCIILLIEIIVRFVCFLPKWRLFFYSYRNICDLIIAIITSIIAIPSVFDNLGRGYAWLTFFQILRWYRVVLAVGFVRKTWTKVLGHVKTIFDLSLFYFIFLFLTSIIMSRFYEGTVPSLALDDQSFSMQSLMLSFISLYAITSTENWTTTLYTTQQYATTKSQQFLGALYLIFWFMFSNMIVWNIFIAVISENLSVPESAKRTGQILQYLQRLRRELKNDLDKGILADFKERLLRSRGQNDELRDEIWSLLLSGKVKGFSSSDTGKNEDLEATVVQNRNTIIKRLSFMNPLFFGISRFINAFRNNPFFKNQEKHHKIHQTDISGALKGMIENDNELAEQKEKYLKENPTFNTVFYMLPPNHKLRRFCQRIVPPSHGHRVDGVVPNRSVSFTFNLFMFLVTCGVVVVACAATPLYRRKILDDLELHRDWLTIVDLSCTLLFSLEFLIKIIADGLIFTPNAYLVSSWNIIDLLVLITMWISLITTLRGSGSVSNLMNGFKALRALRLLTLSSMAKSTFQHTVIAGFRQMMSAATISITLLLPFTIWGLNLFNGRLGYCLDGTSLRGDCYGEYSTQVFKWDIISPNAYVQPNLRLNNFRESFLSLFEIISLEGWVDLLQNLMASTGVGSPPSVFASPANGIFFVMFNFISTVFILTLFVSVIIQNYARNTGRAYQTKEQSGWYEVEKILKQVKASKRGDIENYSKLQLICHNLITQRNKYWRMFINSVLVLHTIALLLEVYPSINGLDITRYVIYLITTFIFMVNFVLIIIARGPRTYLSSNWNWLLGVLIFGAFITSVISFFVSRETSFSNINKLFLVGLLVLIIPRIDRLEQLLRYALASLPSLISLLYTWGILFLVYAIALNQIFGLTRTGSSTSNNINTRTVTKSMILLFRMSFGEGWNYIMDDFSVTLPNCSDTGDPYSSDCGNKLYAYLLFISWNIVSMYILLNMFVSLIVDSFSYIYHASDPHSYITRAERRLFKQNWLKFDPSGSGYIDPNDLEKFLGSLSGVLSYRIYNEKAFTIPELKKRWFKNVDDDPYSVFIDYPEVNATLSQIDPRRVRIRRLKYERLVKEILTETYEKNLPGVSFTSVILKIALYAHFEENTCLTLSDFMKRYVAMDKVDSSLRNQKVYDTLKTVIARWRYKKGQHEKLLQVAKEEAAMEESPFADKSTPRPPLIFISQYMKSEDELGTKKRSNTLESSHQIKELYSENKSFGRNNNLIYDDNTTNPFEDSLEDISSPFANPFSDDKDIELFTNSASGNDADLHLRLSKSSKVTRDLTGGSATYTDNPFGSFEQPVSQVDKSMDTAKDTISPLPRRMFREESDTTSLLSVDLSSPRPL